MVSQQNRLGAFVPPDGTDKLALLGFSGTEAVNELYAFEVKCLNPRADIDPEKLLGRNASVRLNTIDKAHPPRHFDGLVTDIACEGRAEGGQVCTLTLRPWLWLLSLRQNQRIFHNKTAPEILTEIFQDYGFPFKSDLEAGYPTLEYTVQFQESDLDFVRRMMSEFGISFRFAHARHAHELILFDETSSLPMVEGGSRPYRMTSKQHRDKTEHLHDWTAGRKMTTGKVSMVDYNFTDPKQAMGTDESQGSGYAMGEIESFIYPGRYPDKTEGDAITRMRVQQMAQGDGRHRAEGDCASFMPGQRVTIKDHPDGSIKDKTFAVLSCRHNYVSEGYRSGSGGGGEGDSYTGSYEFMDADRQIRPGPAAARPHITGPMTALVVGEGEIDTDWYGRILLRFWWDIEGAHSMRCRVVQSWAGSNWGSMVIPRVGMEVLVEFLNGDPSYPVVIGCVYNNENLPPYDLPGEKNQTGMKSNSTPGGGGYTEFTFDDTKGKAEVRLHAQYDFNAVVLNNTSWTTHVDQSLTVGQDLASTVGRDENRTVGRHRETEIGETDTLDVGDTLKITAGNEIVLKVGMCSITMTTDRITLKAPTVEIKAMQQFSSTAGMNSEHKAGMMFDIKGAMVKINS